MTPITSSVPSTAASAGSVASTVNSTEIASNFTTFLQLLTTQLKNQDPLSPMDTNQFTQQLVEFASVEQQMKSNSSLTTLVSLEQAAQSTSALALGGATVVVDGSTTPVAPTRASADFDCAACSSDTRVVRELFDFICCSTDANSTSCWVNWLVSIGLSGSWFLSCVVSSCRNVVKLLAISVLFTVLATEPAEAAVEGTEEVIGVMVNPQTRMSIPPRSPARRL